MSNRQDDSFWCETRDVLCLAEPDPAPRVCLVCDREFPSEGPWNRICPDCWLNDRERLCLSFLEDAQDA